MNIGNIYKSMIISYIIKIERRREMKKLFGAILASLMVLNATGSLMTIHAHESTVNKLEIHECEACDNTIEPRVVKKQCLNCAGYNTTTIIVDQEEWSTSSTKACIHYNYGVDVTQKRSYTYKISCNTCGFITGPLTATDTQVICRGYN